VKVFVGAIGMWTPKKGAQAKKMQERFLHYATRHAPGGARKKESGRSGRNDDARGESGSVNDFPVGIVVVGVDAVVGSRAETVLAIETLVTASEFFGGRRRRTVGIRILQVGRESEIAREKMVEIGRRRRRRFFLWWLGGSGRL
jgi:hypothetical protein